MAFKSEFQVWRDELQPAPRLSIAERVAAWFDRPASEPPAVDHFVWIDLAETAPIAGEDQ